MEEMKCPFWGICGPAPIHQRLARRAFSRGDPRRDYFAMVCNDKDKFFSCDYYKIRESERKNKGKEGKMKKIGAVIFVVLCLVFFQLEIATAGVYLRFDYQKATKTYIKFTYEFGAIFISRAKVYPFLKDYSVEVLEETTLIRYEDCFKKELIIGIYLNKENIPSIWVKSIDLEGENEQQTDKKIKEKAKEFSDKVFQRLLQMERERVAKGGGG